MSPRDVRGRTCHTQNSKGEAQDEDELKKEGGGEGRCGWCRWPALKKQELNQQRNHVLGGGPMGLWGFF